MAVKFHRFPLLFLVLMVAAVYGSSLGHNFIPDWDDSPYVIANPAVKGFSVEHLRAAFTTFYSGNYAPLHIVSYMLDYTLWGLRPGGFIFSNILLHATNGLLLYGLLIRSEFGKGMAFVSAAIFLLHPVQVESVVWVSQRKNLLALLFFLISFHAYLGYRSTDGAKKMHLYFLSLAAFLLALLSKSAAIVLPVALLLHDVSYQNTWQTIMAQG